MALQLHISVEIAQKTASLPSSINARIPRLSFWRSSIEILHMQVQAIIEAAINVKRKGIEVHPEIMIPLVGHYKSSSSPAACFGHHRESL